MKSQTFYLETHRLIIEVVHDPINVDLMISLKQKHLAAGWIQPNTNLLVSIHTDIVELKRQHYDDYLEWASQHLTALIGSKVAVVVNSPLLSALNTILKERFSDSRNMEIFTTLRAAATWLNVPKEEIIAIANDTKEHDLE